MDQQTQDRGTQLSQMVEKDVRALIGDLQMQIIVLRSMLEMSGQSAQPTHVQPQPPHKSNGHAKEARA